MITESFRTFRLIREIVLGFLAHTEEQRKQRIKKDKYNLSLCFVQCSADFRIRRMVYYFFRIANPNTHYAVDCKSWAVER